MNWEKLDLKFPLVSKELRVFQELTGLDGDFLVKEYIVFNDMEYGFFLFPSLFEIESKLKSKQQKL